MMSRARARMTTRVTSAFDRVSFSWKGCTRQGTLQQGGRRSRAARWVPVIPRGVYPG